MKSSLGIFFTFLLIGVFSPAAFGQVENAPKNIQAYVDREAKKEEVPAEINKLIYGDVNGDGVKDAVIQYNIQIGYPGNDFISYIAVFLSQKGKYVFATRMENGAKLSTVLVPRTVKNKLIIFDKYGENGFKKIGSASYRLAGKKLVKVK
jgi:hypothetical protein